ncbi:unnamed protein product [Pedinophyceae sp. YPF-701]|nr:unnamed protein product [Pedinophyceae sp. YPF-701]
MSERLCLRRGAPALLHCSGGKVEPQKPYRERLDPDYADLMWFDGTGGRTLWDMDPYRLGRARDAMKFVSAVAASAYAAFLLGREMKKMKRPRFAPRFHPAAYDYPEDFSRRPWAMWRYAHHDSDIVWSGDMVNTGSFSETVGQRAQLRAQASGRKTLSPA